MPAKTNPPAPAKNAPVFESKVWPVRAAVWRNETGDGKPFYNVTVERAYKSDVDTYKSSNSFGRDDLLLLNQCLLQCFWWIVKQEEKDHQASQ